ncbi:GNVR domain-containing protein [Pseudovibrio exalbescens]|uniref:GumC family protein n=1 Tax=Pseudovibrio exalbescens TaxID=197461 RepID=UPI0023662127|nr:GNVR domain-containing protein [Pseudovibrio exalbescens]MDD7909222.1 GNVR domain-containing protein [Pseudovibrio exalbescens]
MMINGKGRSIRDFFLLVLEAAWRRRYMICIPMLILPAMAFFVSDYAPKRYAATMTVLVQEPARLNPFLEDLAIGPNLKERMPALDALLHSEHVLGRVLEDVGDITPSTPQRERELMVRSLSTSINAQLVGNDLVQLTITSTNPNGLAAKLEAVGERFLERLLSPERSAVDKSGTFLAEQLAKQETLLRAKEDELAEFKTLNADKLPSVYTANVQRLVTLRSELDSKSVQLASAEAELNHLKKRLASTNPAMGRLEERIVAQTSLLANLRTRYTENHSDVRAAQETLRQLTEERKLLFDAASDLTDADLDRLWNMAAGQELNADQKTVPLLVSQMQALQTAESKREALSKDVALLKNNIAEMEASVAEFGPIEKQMNRLERDIDLAQETYSELSRRYEMAEVTGALGKFEAPERVKIVDAAEDPQAPITPGKVVYVAGGIFAAIMLGVGLAVVFEVLDPTLRRQDEFLAATNNLPIIVRMPRMVDPATKPRQTRKGKRKPDQEAA